MIRRAFRVTAVLTCIAIMAFGLLCGCGTTGNSLTTVKLDSGQISGLQKDGAWSFLGIPYAKPPVGSLRWKPPEPAEHWSGTRSCVKYGPACAQPTSPNEKVGNMSEDCLYLNVWTPASSSSEGLPVMLWIHGGSFAVGSGTEPVFDGHNLSMKGVVVVTINYRLGPFGFLAYPPLSTESPNEVSGNYGIEDQIQALKWVKTNIGAFGGDPANVTVFGQSAGAMSTEILMVSPQCKGLFKQAIPESSLQWNFGFFPPFVDLKEAEKNGEQLATSMGCSNAKDPLAAMRAKTSQEVLAAWGWSEKDVCPPRGIQFLPVVDGWLLPDQPTTLFNEGKQHDVSTIIGSNLNDGTVFGSLAAINNITASQYQSIIRSNADDSASAVLAMYPADTDAQVPTAVADLVTQMDFASFPHFVASSAAKNGQKAFLYQFTRVPPTTKGSQLGSYHDAELAYVFGNLDMSQGYDQTDIDLSRAIMSYWTTFAKTGDPNGAGQPKWPAFGPQDQNLELGSQIQTRSGLYPKQYELAYKIYVGNP